MKKYLMLLLLVFQMACASKTDSLALIFTSFEKVIKPKSLVYYCDTCGCSANGGSMGFTSLLNTNFVGVRYLNQSYTTRQGIFDNSPWVNEHFNSVQIWSKIPVSKTIQISALLPYLANNRQLASGIETINGIGDATVLAMATVFETKNDSAFVAQKWQIGGGLKVPTGKYSTANNGTLNPSFQLGSGSWDYLLLSEYVVKKQNIGLHTAVNYTIKSENKKGYQFGNQLNYGATLFYLFNLNTIKIVPQVGFAGEVFEANKQFQQTLSNTSGSIVFNSFGFEIGIKKWGLGCNAMTPLNQNLNNGAIRANYRFLINFNYSL